jgi:hypothetical protein
MSGRTIVSSRGSFAAALVLVLTLGGAANAAAVDPADALIEQGVKLRVEGRHAEALEVFTKAHALSPSARTLAQIGLAEGSLRRWLDAEGHLAAALETHDTPWIENRRNREALEQALASVRSHIGRLIILGPEGTEVSVGGKVVGRLPLATPVRLPEGETRIDGRAPDRKPAQASVTVIGGSESTVILDLPVVLPPVPILKADQPSENRADAGSRWMTWTGASLLGVSAAALATGIVWLAIDGQPECSPPGGATCYWVRDTKTQGWIAVGAGAALGITGGVFLWKGRSSEAHLVAGPGVVGAKGTF